MILTCKHEFSIITIIKSQFYHELPIITKIDDWKLNKEPKIARNHEFLAKS